MTLRELTKTIEVVKKEKKDDMIGLVDRYINKRGEIDSELAELLAKVVKQNLTPKKSKAKSIKNIDNLFTILDDKVFIENGTIFNYTNYQIMYFYNENLRLENGCYKLDGHDKIEEHYNRGIYNFIGKEKEMDFTPIDKVMVKEVAHTDKYKMVADFNGLKVDFDLIKVFLEVMNEVEVYSKGRTNEPVYFKGYYPNSSIPVYLVTMGLTI